jgi:hypothetical protein
MPPERFDQDEAARLVCDTYALVREFLPDPEEERRRLQAEFRDAALCGDSAASERHRQDLQHLLRFYDRTRAMWEQAKEARDALNMDRLRESTDAIRSVAEAEFRERGEADR